VKYNDAFMLTLSKSVGSTLLEESNVALGDTQGIVDKPNKNNGFVFSPT
jgi:hypothetical protein